MAKSNSLHGFVRQTQNAAMCMFSTTCRRRPVLANARPSRTRHATTRVNVLMLTLSRVDVVVNRITITTTFESLSV